MALLAAGARVDKKDVRGSTPLHRAVARGDREVALALLAGGADVHARDKDGRTALELAGPTEHEDSEEMRAVLLRFGAA